MAVERPVHPAVSFSWRRFFGRMIRWEMARVRVAVRWFLDFGHIELKMGTNQSRKDLSRAAILVAQLVLEARLQGPWPTARNGCRFRASGWS